MGGDNVADALILTTVGLAKLAVATPENPVNITEIAVGDGNGGYQPLSPSMTNLVREVWRGTASAPIREPDSPTVLKFETVIPATDGGFFIRELGLFDNTGAMIAIAQCSVVEKPSAMSSTALTMTVTMRLTLANASQTQVVINDQPYIDHQGLSNRGAPDAHPMAAITGLTGLRSFNATEALSLPSTIAGAVRLKSTAYNMRAILPKAADLPRAVEVTLYLSHDSTHPVMVRAGAGDALNMPEDVKYHSVPGELILRPTGGWVTLRSTAGGWEVVAANTHLRDPNDFERGMPFAATLSEARSGEDFGKMITSYTLHQVAKDYADSGIAVFVAVGAQTFTVPDVLKSGKKKARVTVIGGGGGGGGYARGGGGGGGGGMAVKHVDLTGISTVAVTVGGGGSGAAAGTANLSGANGGSSSFGSFVSAFGGFGAANWRQGASGVGVGGDYNFGTGSGSGASNPANPSASAKFGGGSGGGGLGAVPSGSGDVGPGSAGGMGSGGSGSDADGTTHGTGGAGGSGCVLIEW